VQQSERRAVARVRAALAKRRRSAHDPITPRSGPIVLSRSYLRRIQQRVRRAS
jgi:hypothetical protein